MWRHRRRARTLTLPVQPFLRWTPPCPFKLLPLRRVLRLQRPSRHLLLLSILPLPNSLCPSRRVPHTTNVTAATKRRGRLTCGGIMKAPNTLDRNTFVHCAEERTQGSTTSSN